MSDQSNPVRRPTRRPTQSQRTQVIRWILELGAEKVAKKNATSLAEEASKKFGFPFSRGFIGQVVGDLGFVTRQKHGRRAGERSGLGNARRIMFLARIVKSLFQDLGKSETDMLELLCSGNSLPDDVAGKESP